MNNPLDNFKNPFDIDGEYAKRILNSDTILDTSKIFNTDFLDIGKNTTETINEQTHDYYYHLSYELSSKYILKDGTKITYKIPKYALKNKNSSGWNRYFYLISSQKIPSGTPDRPYDYRNKNEIVRRKIDNEFDMDYTYMPINSPMTIKGGDLNDLGFNSTQLFDIDAVRYITTNWIKENKWKSRYDIDMYSDILLGLVSKKIKVWIGIDKEAKSGLVDDLRTNAKLDFKFVMNLKEDILYEIEGVSYNKNEIGNFAVGYALAHLGFSIYDIPFISHEGTYILDNNRTFDEPWELDAMYDGFYYFHLFKLNIPNGKQNKIDMYSNPNK